MMLSAVLSVQVVTVCHMLPPPLVLNDGTPLAGFEKFLLTEAAEKGAVCLDGSPGGGYIRRGDPDKWIIVS